MVFISSVVVMDLLQESSRYAGAVPLMHFWYSLRHCRDITSVFAVYQYR